MDYRDLGWMPASERDEDVPEERIEEAQRLAQLPAGVSAPVPSTLTGNIRFHHDLPSRFLDHTRDVIVYLPPDYEESTESYPVLYLQDGQNLFDAATAYVPGHDWKADETAEELIKSGQIRPLIMIGIYHAGEARLDEYTPTRDQKHSQGGKARLYGRFLTEELKPFIDSVYRTLPGPRHTTIGGSSLGGLVSIFTALNYSDVFGSVMALSPSVWWNEQNMVRRVKGLGEKRALRIWLDMGTEEGAAALRSVRKTRDALVSRGWVDGEDLHYVEIKGAQHSEDAWAARFGDVLRWLYPTS